MGKSGIQWSHVSVAHEGWDLCCHRVLAPGVWLLQLLTGTCWARNWLKDMDMSGWLQQERMECREPCVQGWVRQGAGPRDAATLLVHWAWTLPAVPSSVWPTEPMSHTLST